MARYEKGHKLETRQRILDVAARQFREGGLAAVGLAGIMAEAGLTNGAFYVHFESKEDLVRAVLGDALSRREEMLRAAADGDNGLQGLVRNYLSPRHRDDPGGGCPTAAMVTEIARHSEATREAFTAGIDAVIDLIAAQIGVGMAFERRKKAMAVYGMMLGTLQLARAVTDERLSDNLLESGQAAALALAEQP